MDGGRRPGVIAAHPVGQPLPFGRGQPARFGRTVGEHERHGDAERDGRQSLEQEQPLPAGETEPAVERQERAGQRRANHARQRRCGHEQGHRARPLGSREPLRQVEEKTGEESGLGRPEDEPQRVEAPRAADEHHRRRRDPPRDHDARDPEPDADAHQQQIAGDLEDRVGNEKQPGAEAVHSGAEAEIAVHRQRREADVDPIEIGDDVEREHERQQPPARLAERRAADVVRHCRPGSERAAVHADAAGSADRRRVTAVNRSAPSPRSPARRCRPWRCGRSTAPRPRDRSRDRSR